MAERALPAFGRYVKMLRERRGLSLDDAAALTRVYPSPLNKGYVSRVERGLTRVGFEKMIAIARAYEVPVDVLAERLWLDLELDTTKPPETGEREFLTLVNDGVEASSRGLPWHVYAFLRDALPLAIDGPLAPLFSERTDQVAVATTNLAAAAMRLGGFRLALHEMKHALAILSANSPHAAMVSTHLASLYRRTGDSVSARHYADEAILSAEHSGRRRYLGYALASRGTVAHDEKDFAAAIEFYRRAIEVHREFGLVGEEASVMANIAQAFFDLGRNGATRRALAGVERLAATNDITNVRLRARILLGEVEERDGNIDDAMARWRDAAELARQTRDRTLLFKADFLIFRRASRDSNHELARVVGKKLARLAPWVLPDIPELNEFREMYASARLKRVRRTRDVAT